MIQYDTFYKLKSLANGFWGERIIYELHYLCELSENNNGKFDEDINKAILFLQDSVKQDGAICNHVAISVENSLLHLSKQAKALTVYAVSHSHSDMNWMWGYNETASIVLSTFSTMLDLLEEYPQFKFSQSQAAAYKIVEELCPEMLERIKPYVANGRWELSASEWVECDHNLLEGESYVRQIMYSKQYLSKIFDINPDDINLCFSPDTFGHNLNLAEMLSGGNIKYMYFCRGVEKGDIFRYKAPSGRTLLAHREPHWYNTEIKANDILDYPSFAKRNNVNAVLKVYGVGNHGGGATRKDIEKIIELSQYPLFPTIKFGTYAEYFKSIENDSFPVIDKELNFLNTGCYTSQSRIKSANKNCQRHLYNAEFSDVVASSLLLVSSSAKRLTKSWETVLFNQFHDILPGSCMIDSREYAMGKYQEALASADTVLSCSLKNYANNIDYSKYMGEEKDIGRSFGAGVGFCNAQGMLINNNNASGSTRIFTLFNTIQFEKNEVIELILWDYDSDIEKIEVTDTNENPIIFSIVDHKSQGYWGHAYNRIEVLAKIPAYSYISVIVKQKINERTPIYVQDWERAEPIFCYCLENEYLKAEFDRTSLKLISLYDKENSQELLSSDGAYFRFAQEDTTRYMTSWITGRDKKIEPLTEGVICEPESHTYSNTKSTLSFNVKFGKSSKLAVNISLNKDSRYLNFQTDVDFREFGSHEYCVPTLEFFASLKNETSKYIYDCGNLLLERDENSDATPACNFAYGAGVMLVSKDRNGFQCEKNSIRLKIVRGSFEPDPTPEISRNITNFALCATSKKDDLYKFSYCYLYNFIALASRANKGKFKPNDNFIFYEGKNIIISAIKNAEKNDGIIVRLFNTTAIAEKFSIKFGEYDNVFLTDNNENVISNVKNDIVVDAYRTLTLKLTKRE